MLTHAEATKERLLRAAESVPGAWVGLKIAALLLVIEGQRPGWICEVLSVTRMRVSRWIHAVNQDGVGALTPKPRPGRPTRLAPKVQQALPTHLEKPPGAFGMHRAQWDGPHGCCAPKAAVWDKVDSAAGPAVDAPPR